MKAISLALLACSLLAANVHAQEVIGRISAPALHQIFRDEGYSFEIDQDGDIILKVEGSRALVMRTDEGLNIMFRMSFTNSQATLEKVNAWNRTKRFSRSYIDNDGAVILELDLDFEGGITKGRVINFIATCRDSVPLWVAEVVR